MCGIAGFCGPGDRGVLAAMTEALRHRGPDDFGHWSDAKGKVHLGHRRLAVIDLEGGHQPMLSRDGKLVLIYNGEIYNHGELRSELESLGHRFVTDHSDTEVLVHGYQEWELALAERLNGMFAFALYDRVRDRIVLARDRFGEKPLYYLDQAPLFAFASELRALVCHPLVARSLDVRSLQKMFAYGFVPAPHALLAGARKLPGGCVLVHELATGRTGVHRYWRFTIESDPALEHEREEVLVEKLRGLLDDAVRRRLVSDVPLGLFLSGGLDSSTVLAFAANQRRPDEIKTFTIGFTEPSFDESIYAKEVATTFGSCHREQMLGLGEARALIPEVLGKLDEPFGDPSILPTWMLSAFTRRHVTVALSGDGGDELFAGYDPFAALAPARIYRRIMPQRVHQVARRLADLLPISTRNMSLDFKLRRTLTGLGYPPAYWNPVWLGPLSPEEIQEVFLEPLDPRELYEEALVLWERDPRSHLVDRTLEFYTNLYLQDGILAKTDRASMMVSLEARAVFLDNDLVEFCRRLPWRWKLRGGKRKYLLRRALEGLVPDTVIRRSKKGFGIPVARWLREIPSSPPLAPVPGVCGAAVERRWAEHRAGRADHRLFLWSWLALQSRRALITG